MKKKVPSYEELLEKIKFQELEISNLLEYKQSVNNSENIFSETTQNIAGSKKKLDKITLIEKRFRALLENNEGIVSLIDENLNTIFLSSSAARITGWDHEEFEKISIIDYIHLEDIEELQKTIQKALDNPRCAFSVLLRVRHKEGHYIWMEGSINNMLNDPEIRGIITNLRDVTERKKSEEILREERDKFAKIAATAPGLIYSMRQNKDGSLCYPYVSNAVGEIYGFTFSEVENDPNKIFSLIHPEDLDFVMKSVINTKTKLIPLKGEYRYFHPIKGLVWHEMNSLPILEPEGTVICHGVITDITERILSQKKIIKANRLYLFISQINQMIFRTTDEQTLFKETCSIAVNLGKFKLVWIGVVDPNTNQVVPIMFAGEGEGYLSRIKKITIDDKPEGRGPTGSTLRNGKYTICNDVENDLQMLPWRSEALKRGFLSLMSLPIIKFGKVFGAISFYAGEKNFFDCEEIALLEEATGDIAFALENFEKETLHKKAEEAVFESEKRYHTLTEVSPVGIFRSDETGIITYVNERWCEITGLSFNDAMGDKWTSAVHKDDLDILLDMWKNSIDKNIKTDHEFRFVHPDGSIVWVLGQSTPEINNENKVLSFIGTITNITELKLMETELIKAKELAESANKAKTDFLANMSHEIRTPLNGIIGFTHLLMEANLKKKQAEYMATINESANLLMHIVNDVLDFSKIESGKLELNIEEINLFKLSNDIVDLFKYQSDRKNIELSLNIDDNVPQYVLGDYVRLKQVLVNLLSNAVKFTDFGEIRLNINEVGLSDKKWSTIMFSVADTGIGIKETNNEIIFKSFMQEDNSTNRKFGGTGLGLAISNNLLGLMNSKLELISHYGEGSNFFFIIKFKKSFHKKNIAPNQTNTTNDKNSIPEIVHTDKKILIVEDNSINMLLAKKLVKAIIPNATICEAKDGNEAVEKYIKEKPNLILMDIQMPNKNGYEAVEEIRKLKDSDTIPIIALTAGIMTGDKEKCIASGMDDYLPKPIIREDLKQILNKWLNV